VWGGAVRFGGARPRGETRITVFRAVLGQSGPTDPWFLPLEEGSMASWDAVSLARTTSERRMPLRSGGGVRRKPERNRWEGAGGPSSAAGQLDART